MHTRVMCCIGCLYPSGCYTSSPLWFCCAAFFAVRHLTCVTSAAQCLMLQHVGCFALLQEVSSWFHRLFCVSCSAVLFLLWTRPSYSIMTSHLSCTLCW